MNSGIIMTNTIVDIGAFLYEMGRLYLFESKDMKEAEDEAILLLILSTIKGNIEAQHEVERLCALGKGHTPLREFIEAIKNKKSTDWNWNK